MNCLFNYMFLLIIFDVQCFEISKRDRGHGRRHCKKGNGTFKEVKLNLDDYDTYEETSYYFDDSDNRTLIEEVTRWYEHPQEKIFVKHIKQKVDHNNPYRTGKWLMKCYQNTRFWKTFSPIYLYVGGNEELNQDILNAGFMFDLANETRGVMFAAEHRFYGSELMDYDIRYLNSQQAIEDLVYLVGQIKKERAYKYSKVVAVGGGYGGSLAVWTKVKYPKIFTAVLASCAPVSAKLDFSEYYLHLKKDFKENVPLRCLTFLENFYADFKNCNDTKRQCFKLFQPICTDVNLNLEENYMLYFLRIASIFSDSAEKGLRYIHRVCKQLQNPESYVKDSDLFYRQDGDCNDYNFEHFIENINKREDYLAEKRWLYQCCNEFGFFPTLSKILPDKNFITLDFYFKVCRSLFGDEFDESRIRSAIDHTNNMYGGRKPKVSNVIFSHGTLDPWQNLGVMEKYDDSNQVVIIPGISHCRDLQPRNRTDIKALVRARKEIKEYIKNMIASQPT